MAADCKPVNQPPENTEADPALCPLCGGPNDCRLCTNAAHQGPCWCESASIPPELLVRVPTTARNRACICRACVTGYQGDGSRRREEADSQIKSCSGAHRAGPPPDVGGYMAVVPGDFYFDRDGMMVFTAAYHRRRGYCCGNDCRHCPFEEEK